MKTLRTKNDLLSTYVAAGLTILIGCINMVDVGISLALITALIVMFVLYLRPHYSLAFLIFLIPFSNTALIAQKIVGIPGFKIINMALLSILVVYLFSRRRLNIGILETFFLFGTIFIITISAVRSLPHLGLINFYFNENFGPEKYILAQTIKPIFYLVPFFIILGYMRDKSDLDFILSSFKYALLFLSIFIVIFYTFDIPNKASVDHVRYGFKSFFNMHTNGLVDFYILGYPIILAWFFYKKNLLNLVNLLLAISCVALLYSRTAYVLVIFSTLLFLVIDKKKKWLPLVLALGLVATLALPETVVERSLTGLEEGSVQKISAGRIPNIWIPLIEESRDDLQRLLIGSGRHTIVHSTSLDKGHAHNMYLNTFLDAGVIGLGFFVAFFFYFVKKIKGGMERLEKGKYRTILTGILVSIFAFLVSGLTGRELFPDITNSYLWILLALGLKIIQIHRKEEMDLCET